MFVLLLLEKQNCWQENKLKSVCVCFFDKKSSVPCTRANVGFTPNPRSFRTLSSPPLPDPGSILPKQKDVGANRKWGRPETDSKSRRELSGSGAWGGIEGTGTAGELRAPRERKPKGRPAGFQLPSDQNRYPSRKCAASQEKLKLRGKTTQTGRPC